MGQQRRKFSAEFRRGHGRAGDAEGNVTFAWHFDQAALDAEAATDGWYALLTNLDAAQADAAEVLRLYKGQEVVERRYGDFKGPLAVSPMLLKEQSAHPSVDHRDLPRPADLLPG